ncbi:Pepco domain-containing protein [Iningainema tapete]|uniref:Pepco domain-containing protein n=1 Tax=Iningainema tapete BLCC-T55 TaxID=2748662 RepID=A0A8J6XJ97_9CYAN|nr:hypothetical protein [Iningainema tapete]MBD2777024.1 hypothetical protein [Iningainema tapete BLCC-T55]
MSERPEDTIWIVTDDTPQITIPDGTKGGISRGGDWGDETEPSGSKGVGDAVKVSVEKLEQEMSHFVQVVGRIFARAERQANANSLVQLDEIELSVEISGEGQVKLIGNGVKAGGKGAIKLKFKRVELK